MTTEYRIILTATFDNATDRDTWYAKIKTAHQNAKGSSPAYKAANMTKDDYMVASPTTEAV